MVYKLELRVRQASLDLRNPRYAVELMKEGDQPTPDHTAFVLWFRNHRADSGTVVIKTAQKIWQLEVETREKTPDSGSWVLFVTKTKENGKELTGPSLSFLNWLNTRGIEGQLVVAVSIKE